MRFFQTNFDKILIEPLLVKFNKTLPTLRSFPTHIDNAGKVRITLPLPQAYIRNNNSSIQYYDAIPKERPTAENLPEETEIIVQQRINNHNLLFNLQPA